VSTNSVRSLQRSRIRVLVVDDSVVIRNVVSLAFRGDPALEVVGTASNGAIAMAKIPQVNPDVITLDIEMPGVDGLETIRQVRAKYPEICIIMFSTLSTPGAAATLDALMLGANDYVPKPSNCGSIDQSIAVLREELIHKIKQFFRFAEPALAPLLPTRTPVAGPATERTSMAPAVVAIGVSTGGPNALSAMMPMFPADFGYPVLIVQHMPQVFTRLLAERLQKLTALKVEEAEEGSRVEAGRVLIAPGAFHMTLRKAGQDVVVTLDQSMPRNSCRPSVDVLFESIHSTFGGRGVACVLTGMGQDGLRGAELLRSAGAFVIAQDEPTSVVWGMPGYVVKAGLADAIVPLDQVVPTILTRCSARRLTAARRLS